MRTTGFIIHDFQIRHDWFCFKHVMSSWWSFLSFCFFFFFFFFRGMRALLTCYFEPALLSSDQTSSSDRQKMCGKPDSGDRQQTEDVLEDGF